MNINFIAIGKLKERYFRDACDEYLKRLSAFARVSEFQPTAEDLPQSPSPAQIRQALDKEGKKIQSVIKGGFTVALCVEGKQITAKRLAEKFDNLANSGVSAVNFIIGSSYGLSEDVKNACDLRLSMSEMTFPHSLARVMLFEQVYRAFSIMNNSKYDK